MNKLALNTIALVALFYAASAASSAAATVLPTATPAAHRTPSPAAAESAAAAAAAAAAATTSAPGSEPYDAGQAGAYINPSSTAPVYKHPLYGAPSYNPSSKSSPNAGSMKQNLSTTPSTSNSNLGY